MTHPLHATHHCRHYSYERGKDWPLGEGAGPRCALGVDLTRPGSSAMCMPDGGQPRGLCSRREDYTDAERAAWRSFVDAGRKRLAAVMSALPRAIPVGSSVTITCPCCGGGVACHRWQGGAAVVCTTPDCAAVRLNIAIGAEWPAPKEGE